jgi:ribose transport system ATP-binding protein
VTRGIDVGAKAEIFKLLRNLKENGISILLVSSEIEEILAECDRTLIMWNGRIVGDVSCGEMDRQKLLSLAMGVGDKAV